MAAEPVGVPALTEATPRNCGDSGENVPSERLDDLPLTGSLGSLAGFAGLAGMDFGASASDPLAFRVDSGSHRGSAGTAVGPAPDAQAACVGKTSESTPPAPHTLSQPVDASAAAKPISPCASDAAPPEPSPAPTFGYPSASIHPGAISAETQSVLESLRKTREAMWSVVPQMVRPPAQQPQPVVAPTAQTRSVSVQVEDQPNVGLLNQPDPTTVRKEFEQLAQTMLAQLLPELQARREFLTSAVHGIDARQADLRRLCMEAEREGREEFEALRGHLASVEGLKLSVMERERSVRKRLVEDIDTVCQKLQRGRNGVVSTEEMVEFIRGSADLRMDAETLRSKAYSLPHVEVPIHDVPFEARTRAEKLRQLAVMEQLQSAKDLALWRMEQQRRQLMQSNRDAEAWLRHLEGLLERYAETLAFGCYFCAETFGPVAANSPCQYNTGCSPRSGRRLAQDPRVPAHLWGSGSHFWIPEGWPLQAHQPQLLQQSRDDKNFREFLQSYAGQDHQSSRSQHPPAQPAPAPSSLPVPSSMPPVFSRWETPAEPPLRAIGGRASQLVAPTAAIAAQLRHIAQRCEDRGFDPNVVFQAFDPSSSGYIQPQEFLHAVAQLGLSMGDDEASFLMAQLDNKVDGKVSYSEFVSHLFRLPHDTLANRPISSVTELVSPRDAAASFLWHRVAKAFQDRGVSLRQVFALFDADGDGVISHQELSEAFRMMRLGLTEGDIDRLLRDIDSNRDGNVNIHDFLKRLQ